MAAKTSHKTWLDRFESLRTTALSEAQRMKANFAAGTDEQRNAVALKGLWMNCAAWRASLQEIRAVVQTDLTLRQYFRDQFADQAYDGAVSALAIYQACGAIMTAIDSGFPKRSQDGYWATLIPAGENLQWRIFTPAQLVTLHEPGGHLDDLIAALS